MKFLVVEAELKAISGEAPSPLPDGWEYRVADILGHDACHLEIYIRNIDVDDACMVFREPINMDRETQTKEQATAAILERCRMDGIMVEPGEIIIDEHGNWTFRGWRLYR